MRRCLQKMTILGWAGMLAGQPPAVKPPVVAAKPAVTVPKPNPTAPKIAAPKVDPLVASIIELKRSGMGEELLIKGIAKEKRAVNVGVAEMRLLKAAGISDRVIGVLMDPDSAGASTANTLPTPAPVVATPASTAATTPVAATPVKRRLAVEEFDFSTVKTSVQAVFGTHVDIGKGIRAMLTSRIQQAGKISVLERAKVTNLMKEQDFGASDRVRKGTGARVGRILGADAVLMGDIVAFGRDDRDKRVGLGAAGRHVPGVGGLLGAVKFGKKEEKAVVVISYRIVDSETSEVIDSGEARGESKRESKGFGGLLAGTGAAVAGSVDMTSSGFAETIIGEAVMSACDQLGEAMNKKIPGLPARDVDIEGRVADVSGSKLTLTVGANDGVMVGHVFEVFKVLGEVRDPVTKEVLDVQTEKTGEMQIVSTREKISVGSYQGGGVTAGAVARRKK